MGVAERRTLRKETRFETVKPFLEVGLDRDYLGINFLEYVSIMYFFFTFIRQMLMWEGFFTDNDIGSLKDWIIFSFLIIHGAPSFLNVSLDTTRNGKMFRSCRRNIALYSYIVVDGFDDIFSSLICYSNECVVQKSESIVLRSRTVSREVADKKLEYPSVTFVDVNVNLPPVHVNAETQDPLLSDLLAFTNPGLGEKLSRLYVRVGATLRHRLDHACRMHTVPDLTDFQKANWDIGFDRIRSRLRQSPGYHKMGNSISIRVGGQDFDDIKYDPKAAAGFPYAAGVKKKHVFDKACQTARSFMKSVSVLKDFLANSVWYTAGRAKLMERSKEPNARVVSYCSFAINLVEMLYYSDFQAWAMTDACPWCAVGFSWFYGGATAFALYMRADEGHAPPGFKYVTLDVKDWDSSMRAYILQKLGALHCDVMRDFGVSETYIEIFSLCFVSMINAVLAFPGCVGIKFRSGLKSGGTATSFNGSLIHEAVFLYICNLHLLDEDAPHKVHSDDNIWLVPIHVTKEMILKGYENLGLTVKVYAESIELGEVDFLSKFCTYSGDGEYVPKRVPPSETMLRLLLPESDRGVNGCKDPWATYCRLYGHMIDAAFSMEVYKAIIEMMRILQINYGLSTGPTPEDFENNYILEGIFLDPNIIDEFGRLPYVPPREKVLELYGVHEVSWMKNLIPVFDWVYSSSPSNLHRSKDLVQFGSASSYRDGLIVEDLMLNYNAVAFRRINHITSPFPATFKISTDILGFHAARLNCTMNHFNMVNSDILSSVHFLAPCNGCEAQMLIRWGWAFGLKEFSVSTIDTVSSYGHLPYPVLGGLYCPFHTHMKVETEDFFNIRNVARDASLVVITPESHVFKPDWSERRRCYCVLKYVKNLRLRNVQNVIMSFSYCDEGVLEQLYSFVKDYGSVELFNPVFSNPWKGTYYVVIRRSKVPPMPRNVFRDRCRGFLNRLGVAMVPWIGEICSNISRQNAQQPLIRNPLQSDEEYLDYLRSQMYILAPASSRRDDNDGIASLCDGPDGFWSDVRNNGIEDESVLANDGEDSNMRLELDVVQTLRMNKSIASVGIT